ncbi:MAG: HAMP domain-containing histidine kinase [Clostridiales bacterium]|nr:HAMP domain-containing histidine kinase [Clostridiales bacterium]
MNVIGKLRWKFVLINMLIVTAMLAFISTFFIVSVSDSLREDSIELLNQVIVQDGMPMFTLGKEQDQEGFGRFSDNGGSVSLPYFTVSVLATGQAVVVTNQFYDLDEETIQEVVSLCLEQEETSGVLRDYSLRYLRSSTVSGWRLAFADISQEESTIRSVVRNTLLMSLAALAAFFVISLLLARWAVRPVEQSWQQQRQFVADASHELKTPLTVVLSSADMMEKHSTAMTEKERRWLENIQASSLQMKELVEELLVLARSDANESKAAPHELLNLSDLVEDTLLQFEAALFESGHLLESELTPDLYVSGDRGKLKRLLEILLDNARKYAARNSDVQVFLAPEGAKRVRLEVRNQGEPIPPDQLERIFERFYRADQARTSEGFGLGLPIARTIAQEHGGKIWAASDDAEGTRFFVSLPRAKAPAAEQRGALTAE